MSLQKSLGVFFEIKATKLLYYSTIVQDKNFLLKAYPLVTDMVFNDLIEKLCGFQPETPMIQAHNIILIENLLKFTHYFGLDLKLKEDLTLYFKVAINSLYSINNYEVNSLIRYLAVFQKYLKDYGHQNKELIEHAVDWLKNIEKIYGTIKETQSIEKAEIHAVMYNYCTISSCIDYKPNADFIFNVVNQFDCFDLDTLQLILSAYAPAQLPQNLFDIFIDNACKESEYDCADDDLLSWCEAIFKMKVNVFNKEFTKEQERKVHIVFEEKCVAYVNYLRQLSLNDIKGLMALIHFFRKMKSSKTIFYFSSTLINYFNELVKNIKEQKGALDMFEHENFIKSYPELPQEMHIKEIIDTYTSNEYVKLHHLIYLIRQSIHANELKSVQLYLDWEVDLLSLHLDHGIPEKCSLFEIAVRCRQDKIVDFFLTKINLSNQETFNTLFKIIMTHGNENCLQRLLEHEFSAQLDIAHWIPSAIKHGSMNNLQLLFKHCSDNNIMFFQNQYKNTWLHFAVYYRQLAMTQYFLDCGLEVNAITTTGKTPLQFAFGNNDFKMMRLLLKHGAQLKMEQSSILESAWTSSNFRTINFILELCLNNQNLMCEGVRQFINIRLESLNDLKNTMQQSSDMSQLYELKKFAAMLLQGLKLFDKKNKKPENFSLEQFSFFALKSLHDKQKDVEENQELSVRN
ncbi:MAG: ankyrin repeat domain-containing protein [Legionella longbeachae]|nr:ankyrin repeat domain-containing protein [Legionella longbeachae]